MVIICMVALAFIAFSALYMQQKQIDKLTDRLMVLSGHKEYREDKPSPEEKPLRKPMSYFDDPGIEVEDE